MVIFYGDLCNLTVQHLFTTYTLMENHKMKNIVYTITIIFCLLSKTIAQTDTLTLEWEPTVNYGTAGQRTVLVNDTLWHIGGRSDHGIPFGYHFSDFSFIEYKSPEDDYWEIDTAKTMFRVFINAESYNGNIYIFGGVGYGEYPEEMEIFNTSSRTISFGSTLAYPRKASGSVQYNGKIYLIGGYDGSHSDRVCIYDISSDSWSAGASLPVAMETEAVYYNGKIIVIGGYSSDGVHDEIFEYDISSDSWSQIGTTPAPVSAHKLAIFQDQIFVIGDYVDLNLLWKYNISDNSWVDYHSNYFGRRHTSTVIYDNKLHIIAGLSKLDDVYQRYNIVQSIDLSHLLTIGNNVTLANSFELNQNYPNPFNPTTTINYNINKNGNIKIVIFDMLGKQVKSLVNKNNIAGKHQVLWNGKNDAGKTLSSGQYYYTIEMDGITKSRKMILLK